MCVVIRKKILININDRIDVKTLSKNIYYMIHMIYKSVVV